MLPTAIQSNGAILPSCSLLSHKTLNPTIFAFPKPSMKTHSSSFLINPPNLRFSASATEAMVTSLPSNADALSFTEEDQEHEVVVRQVAKPRLVLKFIWMEKNIGLGLDQVIPGHGTVPLSPYFFWPRIDAWEELKTTLESKPWISQKKMIILLNQATDIINLWQQSGGNLTA
ncbi:30S ribosomal protein 3, chloroplastic [Linum perenne]